MVKPKKHLGQHFLKDESISLEIASSLIQSPNSDILIEIGPGTGALTKFLLERQETLIALEVDNESIAYLKDNYPALDVRNEDFLKFDFQDFSSQKVSIVGNFPYNISSQILFKVLDYKDQIPEVVGMFQKEVAERFAEGPGSKTYGITSVLLQAFYNVEYLFTVGPEVFDPPPKVQSAVIRFTRNKKSKLNCDEKKFKQIVKLAFNQRRKTMRNSLKSLINDEAKENEVFNLRPEQLSVEEFVALTNLIA